MGSVLSATVGMKDPPPKLYAVLRQGALCSLYNVGHYPTLKFGRPADYEVDKGGKLEDYSGVRNEKEIIEWVGKLQST
jgi:hypothetical protein